MLLEWVRARGCSTWPPGPGTWRRRRLVGERRYGAWTSRRRCSPGQTRSIRTIEFRRADAQSLPFEDAAFDAVVGNFGLPHFARPELAVAESARVLAPGGRLALTTWDAPAEMRMFGVFLEAVAEVGAGPPDGLPPGPDVFRFSDDGEFRRLFEGQGLVDVEVRRVAFTHPVGHSRISGAPCSGGRFGWPRSCSASRRRPGRASGRPLSAVWPHTATDGRFDLPVSVKLAAGRKDG